MGTGFGINHGNMAYNNRTVIVVSGNTEFQQPLLNWIISAVLKANVSLECILILAADEMLYKILKERGIGSIFVPPSSLYDSKSIQLGTHQYVDYLLEVCCCSIA